jgi:hypothetical protein
MPLEQPYPYDTPNEAVAWLHDQKLVFGNDAQIRVVEFVRAAELLIGTEEECDECEGEGLIEVEGHCDTCGAACICCDGEDECEACGGTGVIVFDRPSVYAMKRKVIYSKPLPESTP